MDNGSWLKCLCRLNEPIKLKIVWYSKLFSHVVYSIYFIEIARLSKIHLTFPFCLMLIDNTYFKLKKFGALICTFWDSSWCETHLKYGLFLPWSRMLRTCLGTCSCTIMLFRLYGIRCETYPS